MPKNLQKRTISDLSPLNSDIGVAQTERRLLFWHSFEALCPISQAV